MNPEFRRNTGNPGKSAADNDPAPSRTPARTAQPPAGGRDGADSGALPSNTAPYNCNLEYFKLLRFGVDSLYLSYPGEIVPEVNTRLKAMKLLAQSADRAEQSQAQYPIYGHVFEVKDKAPKGFAYILEDDAFRIQLSRSVKLPAAYVKLSSAYLAHVGVEDAERHLTVHLIPELITSSDFPNVSRIDLFVDFIWSGNTEWDRASWVTRGGGVDAYSEKGIFTGWVVGRGGSISARLYNKSLQSAKIEANHQLELWANAGWQAGTDVWRLEFQLRREVLIQLGLRKLPDVLRNLNGIWSYATTDWLKLTIPNPDDQTRSRWPIHPLWGYLSAVDWETNGGPLTRSYTPSRVPSDDKLFGMALSILVSFMAREGIENAYQGQQALMAALPAHFEGIARHLDLTFDEFLDQKLGIKARQFNTLLNNPRLAQE